MSGTVVESKPRNSTQLAPRWKVIVHDDPVTTFDFVLGVLRRVFAKPPGEARRITREAHDTGSALVDVLALEQAEFRRDQAHSLARAEGFPLTLTLEPAD
ncbi:MAG: ATP-dependent Clp protease adaptor ClpS [Planctomycetes bacterium]|nr:ATP-dependent Clp protease adaptor ClpS [Planctomycetota bacterium]